MFSMNAAERTKALRFCWCEVQDGQYEVGVVFFFVVAELTWEEGCPPSFVEED